LGRPTAARRGDQPQRDQERPQRGRPTAPELGLEYEADPGSGLEGVVGEEAERRAGGERSSQSHIGASLAVDLESGKRPGSSDSGVSRAMSLRPLIEIAAENARLSALAADVRDAGGAGEAVSVRASTTLRPLLLATLLEDERGLAGRPALPGAADDRSARDLAADLAAYLAPRRVRLYPSRGTGYASHVTPPPHLVGLRIDALDALREGEEAVVVASAVALAEAVPDASL